MNDDGNSPVLEDESPLENEIRFTWTPAGWTGGANVMVLIDKEPREGKTRFRLTQDVLKHGSTGPAWPPSHFCPHTVGIPNAVLRVDSRRDLLQVTWRREPSRRPDADGCNADGKWIERNGRR